MYNRMMAFDDDGFVVWPRETWKKKKCIVPVRWVRDLPLVQRENEETWEVEEVL